jgi:uncharacterized membrane protein YuzA (DUF378 family)
MKLNTLDLVALVLVIVGGLNWLLFAFGQNLVSILFGTIPSLETIIYILVGFSAIYLAVIFPKIGRN